MINGVLNVGVLSAGESRVDCVVHNFTTIDLEQFQHLLLIRRGCVVYDSYEYFDIFACFYILKGLNAVLGSR